MTQNTPSPAISGHPDEGTPWVLEVVVRIDKTNAPTRTDAAAAVATAVATFLTQPAVVDPDSPYAAPVAEWAAGRWRKHVRRARRPIEWDRVREVPGTLTCTTSGVDVAVLVPTQVDQIPTAAARLQMTGSELDDPHPIRSCESQTDGPLLVALSAVPFLTFGKAAAAAAHAAQVACDLMPSERLDAWAAAGFPVTLAQPGPETFEQLKATAPVRIDDAGLTEVAPGTTTAVATWA